jgi:DNA polymerase III gamma/tau subunit
LKVLSKAEKQLRIATDQPTWLTAALLQFAPDRSFLPSSVNTSIAHSPAAFDLSHQQRTTATTTTTKNRVEEENQVTSHLKMTDEEEEEASQNLGPALGRTLSAYLENRKKDLLASSIHSEAKVHPAATPPNNDYTNQSELKLEAAWAAEEEEEEEGVQAEIHYASDAGLQPESSSHLLRMMDPQNLEKIWTQVLQVCRSKVLKQLLQSHAHLIAIGIQDGRVFNFPLDQVLL